MKNTVITIISLIIIATSTTFGQDRRKAPQQVGNPFGLGGTVTAGVKNRPQGNFRKRIDKSSPVVNLGDTATHEVGHKGKGRRGAIGEGASDVNAVAKERTETVDNNEYRTKHPAGFVPPSSDPHGKNPTARRKTQNLLPFIEQGNVYKTRNRQR